MANTPIELTEDDKYLLHGVNKIWEKFVTTLTDSQYDRMDKSEFLQAVRRVQKVILSRAAIRSMGGVLDPVDSRGNGENK